MADKSNDIPTFGGEKPAVTPAEDVPDFIPEPPPEPEPEPVKKAEKPKPAGSPAGRPGPGKNPVVIAGAVVALVVALVAAWLMIGNDQPPAAGYPPEIEKALNKKIPAELEAHQKRFKEWQTWVEENDGTSEDWDHHRRFLVFVEQQLSFIRQQLAADHLNGEENPLAGWQQWPSTVYQKHAARAEQEKREVRQRIANEDAALRQIEDQMKNIFNF